MRQPAGYGASSPAPSSHGSVADDSAEVLDLLDITEVAALGMSVGGAYAAAFAARHPTAPSARRGRHAADARDAADRPTLEAAMEAARPEFEAWAASMNVDDPDDEAVAARWTGSLPSPRRRAGPARAGGEIAAAAREALADHRGYLRDAALAFRPGTSTSRASGARRPLVRRRRRAGAARR